ncbi:MAG: SDR family oxidoreductase [Pseudomonadales bacterium]
MDLGLAERKAAVAGGSRGIGRAIALELAREGADVAILSRSQADLEATALEISAETGRRIVPIACDVTDRKMVDSAIERAVTELGGLHILVNSASLPGGSPTAVGRIESIVDEDFLHDFDVKYLGALRCTRAAIPHLQRAGYGRIINISGANARLPGNLSGGARNTSLVHFTRTLALQLGRDGITVNCIHPGMTRTETTRAMLEARALKLGVAVEEAERQDFAPGGRFENAIGRMIDASEVAHLAVFLASDRAAAITGDLLNPSGGVGKAVWY